MSMFTICPQCEAERALSKAEQLKAAQPAGAYPEIAGYMSETIRGLLRYPTKTCAKHRRARAKRVTEVA